MKGLFEKVLARLRQLKGSSAVESTYLRVRRVLARVLASAPAKAVIEAVMSFLATVFAKALARTLSERNKNRRR